MCKSPREMTKDDSKSTMQASAMYYKEVESNPHFPQIEQQIINEWLKHHTFQHSVRGDIEFTFYDGPPFANGLPHYGHLLTGFIKDTFARYQTMLGKKVERKFGWDCHGLPAEMPIEKAIGVSGKKAIEEYGIDKFNQLCRDSVQKYTAEWEEYVNRQARWVDFEGSYKTMDLGYMESVIWAFKTLYDKGLIYKAMRVMPYSWACQTPVSDFETRMDNSYREKKSKAITVTFKLLEKPACIDKELSAYYLVVWTTTPWTLPSNLAIAVGEKIEYVCVEDGNGIGFIIARDLLHKYEAELGNHIVSTFTGSQLIGGTYHPLFSYFHDHPGAFSILPGDFVTTEDGTGMVHIAPGFGEDDHALCVKHGIDLVCPVDEAGKFTHSVPDYAGMQVFEANDPIIIQLKKQGNWLKTEQYLHNYPHCWRTDTPLIYKAIPSWYVQVTAIRDKMIDNNQKINWIPKHIKDGLFGKWLENARDWSISRNRYWGCPIPVWQSDDAQYPHIEVYGSIKELEQAFGVQITDLHRPFIDKLTKPNPSDPTGKSQLKRVDDVLDCWFDSGSMPYAQLHYPFENKELFEKRFPADFIVEYMAQTRGWFYTLLVLSTALFDQPPFLNCICHGVILGDDGQKLSKRLQNYMDPVQVFSSVGADAMRWFMLSSPVMRGQELVLDTDASGIKETQRIAIKPIWNAYNFFTLYANADSIKATFSLIYENFLDKYIIAKCMQAIQLIKKSMDEYDTVSATKASEEFFEVLNNWYIRRSRERFWRAAKDEDKGQAYNALFTVLNLMCRAIAPLLPIITEEIYLGISGVDAHIIQGSVHFCHFPEIHATLIDEQLLLDMARVRDACSAALHIRNNAGIRVRQPLKKITLIGVSKHALTEEMKALVMDEINVKACEISDSADIPEYAAFQLKLNLPIIGKRIPNKVKDIIQAVKVGKWKYIADRVEVADEVLLAEEFVLNLQPKEKWKDRAAVLSSNDALVLLDLDVTDELKEEGVARDVVRAIQQARKAANLNITDRIVLDIQTKDLAVQQALLKWHDYICTQTLGKTFNVLQNDQSLAMIKQERIEVDSIEISISIYV